MSCVLLIKSRNLSRIESGATPPIGIMYLASYIREKRKDEVKLLDLLFSNSFTNTIQEIMNEFKPDIVGISAITNEAETLHKIAKLIKSIRPDTKIVVGGPYVTSCRIAVLDDSNVDVAVIGEGEETFVELLNALDKQIADLSHIKSIIYRNGENIIETSQKPYIEVLDTIPYPAWDLIDINAYSQFKGGSTTGIGKYMIIFTSRGCPYHCTYCHNMFGKRFRARSVDNVLKEIENLVINYDVRYFEIMDDIINFDRDRFKTILKNIINKHWDIKLSFPNGVRTDMLDKETVCLMKDAGTAELSIAIETASQRLQKMIKKNLNLEKVKKIIAVAVNNGLFVRGFFMLGFPTETRKELLETINFAVHSKLHLALFLVVIPFKGTELYNEISNSISDINMQQLSNADYYNMPFNLSTVPNKEFFRIYRYAYMKFYLNPLRIIRIMRRKPTIKDLPLLALRVVKYMFVKLKTN